MITQFTDTLTTSFDDSAGDERNRLLMLCDEFPQLGRMQKIEQAIGYTAGYGIKWMFIAQGLDQMDRIYTEHNSFVAGANIRLAYRPNDDRNAKRLSALLGESTGQKTQEGENKSAGFMSSTKSRSESEVEFARPLMTPGELQQLDGSRLILMRAGHLPVLAHKVTYYNDPHFIPKFEGEKWDLPLQPLRDFPSLKVANDWSAQTPIQPLPDEEYVEQVNTQTKYNPTQPEELEGSEGPVWAPKTTALGKQDIEEVERNMSHVSPQMDPDQARVAATGVVQIQNLERAQARA